MSVDAQDFTVEVLPRPGPIDERRSESAQVSGHLEEWGASSGRKGGRTMVMPAETEATDVHGLVVFSQLSLDDLSTDLEEKPFQLLCRPLLGPPPIQHTGYSLVVGRDAW